MYTPTKLLKKSLILAVGVMALSSLSFAIPVCLDSFVTVATLTSQGGCVLGANTFTGFSITGSNAIGGASANSIDPTFIEVAIQYNSPFIDVITTNSNLSSWSLTGAQQFSFQLNYTVTGGGAYFKSFANSIIASATNPGGASLTKGINNTQFLNANAVVPNAPFTDFTGGPLSTFTVADNFDVHASNFNAALTQGVNGFLVPEPMTSVLVGSGLLALGFGLRRRKRS